jgi:hypothetical protein
VLELDQLRRDKGQAVAREQYERATELCHRITDLERQVASVSAVSRPSPR